MSNDSFTEVTSKSWFGRLGNAFVGVLVGLALILAGIVLLFWNEGRTVDRRKALNEGAATVRSISPQSVDPANQGALVHLTGLATTTQTLVDPDFGVQVQAIRLHRDVEMYQWKEDQETRTEKKLGGGEQTVTTYTYSKTWSGSYIDSGSFKKPEGHENPGAMPLRSRNFNAEDVTVGAFTLPQDMVHDMDAWQPLQVGDAQPDLQLDRKIQRSSHGFYIGDSQTAPKIGDMRVSFKMVPPATVSLFARQNNATFEPFMTKSGGELERLDMGAHTAAQMFAETQRENTMLMWILRAAGLALLVIGFTLMLKPISVALDVVPLLGNLAETGIFLVSLLLGLVIGLLVVAVAWLFYRPLLGGGLILGAGLLLFLLIRLRGRGTAGADKAVDAMPPPPPPR